MVSSAVPFHLRVIAVLRDIIYIIIILYSWYLVICEHFWPYVWNNWSWVMHTMSPWFLHKNRVWSNLTAKINNLGNGKKAKQNWSFKITQLPWQLLTWNLYHCFAHPVSENRKAFRLSVSWFISDIMRVAHISSKSCRCLYRFLSKPPAKFNSQMKDMKSRRISYPSALIGCNEVAGSRYYPSGAEKL
jgi:hypothetical protein